jgi:ABC-type glycerol-3-phosphate transport system permease component
MAISLVLLSIVISMIIGYFGRKLRFGFWGYFFVSVLFTPIIGLLMLFAGLPRPDSQDRRTSRR